MQNRPSLPSMANVAGDATLSRASHLPFDFVAVSIPPDTPEEKRELQVAVDDYLRQCVDRLLSSSDRATVGPDAAHRELDDAGSDRIAQALDTTIFALAPELGWRLFYSERVKERVAAWFELEPNGVINIERLCKQLTRGARARRGKTLPITAADRQFKDSVVPELKLLRNFLTSRQATQNQAMDDNALLNLATADIERYGSPYPHIQHNRASFVKLVRSTPRLLLRLVNRGITPAVFADEWVGRVRNQKPESARQAMSEAPSRSRSQVKRPTPKIGSPKL